MTEKHLEPVAWRWRHQTWLEGNWSAGIHVPHHVEHGPIEGWEVQPLFLSSPEFTAETVKTIVGLLRETRNLHRDIDSGEYNECETDECDWCKQAGRAIAALQQGET